MEFRTMQQRARGTTLAAAIALIGAVGTAGVLGITESAGAASAHVAGAALLSPSVHPPTFNDAKLFGLRNALVAALKGKSVKKVDTWMVVNILATYWVAGKQGDARAAKELGIAAHYEGPSQGQLATQVSMYNALASGGATGYFTSVIDPVSEGSIINKAVGKGIDVVAIDSPVPAADAKTFTYVGTPNVTAGLAAGAAMKKALPSGGDVAILTGSLTATNALQRIQGFKQALAGSNITVTTTVNDAGAAATATSNADQVLASDPKLKGIYGVYSYDGPAAAVEVSAKGDTGKVFVVADDNDLGAYLTTAMKVLGSAKVKQIIKPFLTGGVISTGVGTLTKANLPADNKYNNEIGAG